MNFRKTAFMLVFALIMSVFSGCGVSNNTIDDGLSIVTTCFPPYDFARAVKGDDSNITMLLCAGAEAHSYEPAPLDILKIKECDVFIYIGGEGEVWADEILGSIDTTGKHIIRLSDHAELLEEAEIVGASAEGHHHHDGEEHDDCDFDEHIWTSPKNAIRMTEAVCQGLSVADSRNSTLYRENADRYIAELEKLDLSFSEMIESAPDNMIIVGDRFPFRYLAEDYGLEYYSAFSGCSSESEPAVYTMAFLIDKILENKINSVFYLEFSTKKVAEKLCYATDSEMLPLQSCHNVSKQDFQNNVTYIDLMYQNYTSLKEALYR